MRTTNWLFGGILVAAVVLAVSTADRSYFWPIFGMLVPAVTSAFVDIRKED